MNNKDESEYTPSPHLSRNLHVPKRQHLKPEEEKASEQKHREAAAHIARAKVHQQYPQEQSAQEVTEPYDQTMGAAQPQQDWQQYHTAWQHYYQQYYQRHFLQQIHQEREKHALDRAAEAASKQQHVTGGDPDYIDPKTKSKQAREALLGKVKERAQKARQSHHFLPIVSAVVVGLLFLFLQYNRVLVAQVSAYISPGSTSNQTGDLSIDPSALQNVTSEPRLIIPKINVDLPVVYDVKSLKEEDIQEGLKRGAVHYNLPGANSLPGQKGNTVLLGHSSNDVFDQGDYKFVFVLLEKLSVGDTFYLNYEGKRYIYKIVERKVIEPTEVSALQLGTDKPYVTLVTCTPPGTALKRLLTIAEQISPDPSGAAQTETPAPNEEPQQIPANSPTFFDKVFDFLF